MCSYGSCEKVRIEDILYYCSCIAGQREESGTINLNKAQTDNGTVKCSSTDELQFIPRMQMFRGESEYVLCISFRIRSNL